MDSIDTGYEGWDSTEVPLTIQNLTEEERQAVFNAARLALQAMGWDNDESDS